MQAIEVKQRERRAAASKVKSAEEKLQDARKDNSEKDEKEIEYASRLSFLLSLIALAVQENSQEDLDHQQQAARVSQAIECSFALLTSLECVLTLV